MSTSLTKEHFTEMLTEYTLGAGLDRQLIEQAAAVLSVGGGVGLYAYVPTPEIPKAPTDRRFYKLGYLRALPHKGRRTITMDHYLEDVYNQTGEDDTTHLVARYYGEPVHYGEVISAYLANSNQITEGKIREHWFLDAFGPLPPVEIFERGLNKLDAHRYPHYLYGPAYSILNATRCRHEYYLTASCPGCDADEENRTGPWEGVKELDYV